VIVQRGLVADAGLGLEVDPDVLPRLGDLVERPVAAAWVNMDASDGVRALCRQPSFALGLGAKDLLYPPGGIGRVLYRACQMYEPSVRLRNGPPSDSRTFLT